MAGTLYDAQETEIALKHCDLRGGAKAGATDPNNLNAPIVGGANLDVSSSVYPGSITRQDRLLGTLPGQNPAAQGLRVADSVNGLRS